MGSDWFEIDGKMELHNGDGVSYQPPTNKGANKLAGIRINVVQGRRLFPNVMPSDLKLGIAIYRNHDQAFERALEKESAKRHIGVRLALEARENRLLLTLTDTDGITATVQHAATIEIARDADKAIATLQNNLAKLGSTDFIASQIDVAAPFFVPASVVNALRRDGIVALIEAREAQRPRLQRASPIEPPAPYPDKELTYLGNVFNARARNFYKKHGVELIADAYEANTTPGEVSLMITKHCLRYSFNLCPKEAKDWKLNGIKAEPMTLINGSERLTLRFDCKACEMHVMGRMKKNRIVPLLPVG
jgi:23S rRNA 5-hydroxycytidine C2501 synthase